MLSAPGSHSVRARQQGLPQRMTGPIIEVSCIPTASMSLQLVAGVLGMMGQLGEREGATCGVEVDKLGPAAQA